MLLKAGMLYEPETCQFVAGEDTSIDDNAQSIKIVQRYQGRNHYNGKSTTSKLNRHSPKAHHSMTL